MHTTVQWLTYIILLNFNTNLIPFINTSYVQGHYDTTAQRSVSFKMHLRPRSREWLSTFVYS